MKTYTTTVSEGELLGPVDWSFDFLAMFKGYCTTPEVRADLCEIAKRRLRALEDDPHGWEATTDGGWPRVGWHSVIAVGMYDGWPFWKPTPSVMLRGVLGAEWHSFAAITNIRRKAGDGWEEM